MKYSMPIKSFTSLSFSTVKSPENQDNDQRFNRNFAKAKDTLCKAADTQHLNQHSVDSAGAETTLPFGIFC